MTQREPGSPEDMVVQWLNEKADSLEGVFFLIVVPIVQHPYFAVAVLAAVVYLAVAAGKKKRR